MATITKADEIQLQLATAFAKNIPDVRDKLEEIVIWIEQSLSGSEHLPAHKAIMGINKIIALDTLNSNFSEEDYSADYRDSLLNEIEEQIGVFERFGDYYIAIQEMLYFYVAKLYFKVHNYQKALDSFNRSNACTTFITAYSKLKLSKVDIVQRDVLLAYCYEYMGCPEKAITFLFGISQFEDFFNLICHHKNAIMQVLLDAKYALSISTSHKR